MLCQKLCQNVVSGWGSLEESNSLFKVCWAEGSPAPIFTSLHLPSPYFTLLHPSSPYSQAFILSFKLEPRTQ